MDLTQLAIETTAKLQAVWDLIGVPDTERQTFLTSLTESVATLYTNAVDNETERKTALEEETQGLTETIQHMQAAMEESRAVPKQGAWTLLQFRDKLEGMRAELQQLWDTREQELKDLEGVLFSLYDEIDEDIQPSFTSIGDHMTHGRIAQYNGEIVRVKDIKQERGAQIEKLCTEIADLWHEMELEPTAEDEIEARVLENREALGWGQAVIDTLLSKLAALQEEKGVREGRIAAMGKHITELWKRLATPEPEQTEFLENHAGLGENTLTAVETYLAQKQAEFQERLVELIAGARVQITKMWDEMRAGSAQRQDMFPPSSQDGPFTEELFQIHEEYITQLTAALEDLRPILRGIEKREELKADRAEYEAIIADPSRLLARGNSVARLREEKLERRVKKELPAVTKRLREQIKEWETRSGRQFTVDDQRFLDTLDSDDAAEQKAKDDAKAAREAAKGSSAATSTAATAELSKSQRSTSAGRTSVYKAPATAAPTSGPAVAGAKKVPGPPAALTRKPSASASNMAPAVADVVAEENAVIVAKRTTSGTAVSAPAIPLKEINSKPSGTAATKVEPAPVVVSDAAKASAAKILAQL